MDAINASLGIQLLEIAQPDSTGQRDNPSPFAAPTTMGPVVPGQGFGIRAVLTNRGRMEIVPRALGVTANASLGRRRPGRRRRSTTTRAPRSISLSCHAAGAAGAVVPRLFHSVVDQHATRYTVADPVPAGVGPPAGGAALTSPGASR